MTIDSLTIDLRQFAGTGANTLGYQQHARIAQHGGQTCLFDVAFGKSTSGRYSGEAIRVD